MPYDFETTEVAATTDFTLKSREKQQGEVQASETFKASSTGSRPLGRDGELGGIAKRDMTDFRDDLTQERDRAVNAAIARFNEITTEITRKLDSEPDMAPDQVQRLKNQLSYISNKTSDPALDLGGYQYGLPDYMDDPVLDKCVAVQKQLGNQSMTVATVQPLSKIDLMPDPVTGKSHPKVDDLALLSRAVGSSRVDQLMGINALSEEKFGLDSNGKPVGISVGVDGVGVAGDLGGGKSYFLDVDYSSHNIQKGLYDLEAIDYITGQIDRHPGNIFIDPDTGVVKGIDNDLCFPDMPREEMLSNRHNTEMQGKPVVNKPLFMHEDTARKIESMRPETLRASLASIKYPGGGDRGKLSPEEIEGAVTRLKELQKHVGDLRKSGHVVKTFDKQTYDEAMARQEASFQEQFGAKLKTDGKDPSLAGSTSLRHLDSTKKTSYLGSIAVESRKNQLGVQQNEAERMDIQALRTATNSTGKALRSPEHEEFNKLASGRRAELKAEIAPAHQAQKDAITTKLGDYEKRLAKLEKPNLWEKFRALRYGGVEGAKQAFEGKRLDAMQKLGELDRTIDAKVDTRLDGEKTDLWNKAKNTVSDAKLQESQKQDLGPENSQSVKVDAEKEKVGDLKKEQQEKPDAPEQEKDLGPKIDGVDDRSQSVSQEKDLALDSEKEKEIEKVSSIDGEKPTLRQQGSVRDIMREEGVVKRAKEKLGLTDDDNSVRTQTKVSGPKTDTGTKTSVKI